MASKAIVIGVLLVFSTSLLISKPVQARKSKSNSISQSSRSEAADFPCLDNELDSCGLKRKTLNRLRVSLEDLQNDNSPGECQDHCESAAGKTGKRLEQCMCLCNYYSVCLGSIGDNGSGSGTESTKTKSKSPKTKKPKELGSGRLEEEEDTSKSKSKSSKAKSSKSKEDTSKSKSIASKARSPKSKKQ